MASEITSVLAKPKLKSPRRAFLRYNQEGIPTDDDVGDCDRRVRFLLRDNKSRKE